MKRWIPLIMALFLTPLSGEEKQVPKALGKNFGFFPLTLQTSGSGSSTKFPPVAKVVKGMKEIPGFFTLYQKGEKLYALIRYSQLKRPFFFATSISKGRYAGMQWEDMLVYWKPFGRQLLLVRPNLLYRAGNTTLKDIVKKTYPATVIRALPILAKDSRGYLVDLGRILKSNLSGVNQLARFLLGVQGGLNPSLCRFTKVKAFPYNLEIEVDIAFTGVKVRGATPNWTDRVDGRRTHYLGVHYSISHLPATNYRPRLADPRVGYFTIAVKDFSLPYGKGTKFRRYITRWNLEKVDPSLELSPPKKPIVFYMEKTIPYRFRRFVREGILEWNKAFEKIGILNAIEVRQQTDTEFADLDPEDVRYNFFRWVANDFAFAAGPSRVNPLTGEILDADIIFDDSMLRFVAGDFQLMGPSSHLWEQDTSFMKLVRKMKGFSLEKYQYFFPLGKSQKEQADFVKFLQILKQKGKKVCLFSHGMRHQMMVALYYFHLKGKKKIPLEFLGQYVKEIVMHEVGHTLGLYHNFKASAWLPLSKINSKDKPKAIVASVMDYNPINFAAPGSPQGYYFTQTIGPYDYWAIEYGYKPLPASREQIELQKIASRSAQPGHLYGNDLFASLLDPDPHWMRWDLGNDPLAFAKARIKLGENLMKKLLDKAVAKGESYYKVRRAFGTLLGDYAQAMLLASKYIGGMELYTSHKGDPGAKPPVVVVPKEKQQAALEFLSNTVFSPYSFDFDPKVLQHLAPGMQWHWESDELSEVPEYPLEQVYLRIQTLVLIQLLNPRTLWRIQNSALQVEKGKKVFTLADLLNGLTTAIWRELDQAPLHLTSVRRNLQRQYLSIWIDYFVLDRSGLPIPEDAKVLAWQNLKSLKQKIQKALTQKGLSPEDRAHLEEAKQRIELALQAKFSR